MRTPSSARKRKGGEVPVVDGAPSREDPKRRPAGASEEPASDGAGGTCAVPPGSGTSHGGSAIGRTSSSIVGAEGEQSAVVVTPSARAPRLIQPPPKMAPPPPKLPPEPQLASVGHSGFVRRPSQGARPSSGGGVACSLAPERFGMADVGGSSAPDSAESPAEDEVWTHVEFEVWVPCGVLLVLCLAIRWQLCEGVAATLAMVLTCFAGAAVIALAVTPRREREMWWARTLFNELPISLPVMVVFFATLLIFFIASRHSLVVSGTAPTTLPLDGAASSGRSAPALATVRKGLMSRLRRLRSGAKANQSLGAADARLPSADSERGAAERWRRVLWGLIWSAIVLFVPYLAALSPGHRVWKSFHAWESRPFSVNLPVGAVLAGAMSVAGVVGVDGNDLSLPLKMSDIGGLVLLAGGLVLLAGQFIMR